MEIGFTVEGAKSKKPSGYDDAPSQVPMAPRGPGRRNPTTDQIKVRRQMAKSAKTVREILYEFESTIHEASNVELQEVWAQASKEQRETSDRRVQDLMATFRGIMFKEMERRGIKPLGSRTAAGDFQGGGMLHALWITIKEWLVGHNGYGDYADQYAFGSLKESSNTMDIAPGTIVTFTDGFDQQISAKLAAMATASLADQERLAQEVVDLKARRTAAVQADRELDFEAMGYTSTASLGGFARHSTATDWLESAEPVDNDKLMEMQRSMAAHASKWYLSTTASVREDSAEFQVQARGMAVAMAGAHAPHVEEAVDSFLRHALFLNRGGQQALAGLQSTAYDAGDDKSPQTFVVVQNGNVVSTNLTHADATALRDEIGGGAYVDRESNHRTASRPVTPAHGAPWITMARTASDDPTKPWSEEAGEADDEQTVEGEVRISEPPADVPFDNFAAPVAPENAAAVAQEGERTPMTGAGEGDSKSAALSLSVGSTVVIAGDGESEGLTGTITATPNTTLEPPYNDFYSVDVNVPGVGQVAGRYPGSRLVRMASSTAGLQSTAAGLDGWNDYHDDLGPQFTPNNLPKADKREVATWKSSGGKTTLVLTHNPKWDGHATADNYDLDEYDRNYSAPRSSSGFKAADDAAAIAEVETRFAKGWLPSGLKRASLATTAKVCDACQGGGVFGDAPCYRCLGTGEDPESKTATSGRKTAVSVGDKVEINGSGPYLEVRSIDEETGDLILFYGGQEVDRARPEDVTDTLTDDDRGLENWASRRTASYEVGQQVEILGGFEDGLKGTVTEVNDGRYSVKVGESVIPGVPGHRLLAASSKTASDKRKVEVYKDGDRWSWDIVDPLTGVTHGRGTADSESAARAAGDEALSKSSARKTASPKWLEERNNDGYGTPSNHAFWGPGGRGQNYEEVNGWRIFQADDGLWYGYKMRQNAWSTGRPSRDDLMSMVNNNIDVWASRKHAAILAVTTSADGFGNWHASVVTSGAAGDESAAEAAALEAIREALGEREGPNFAPEVVGVKLNRRVSQNGTLTFYYDETNAHEASRKTASDAVAGGYVLPVDAETNEEFPTRCPGCNRPVQRLSVFPGGKCIDCHAAATPFPTAQDVVESWGGTWRGGSKTAADRDDFYLVDSGYNAVAGPFTYDDAKEAMRQQPEYMLMQGSHPLLKKTTKTADAVPGKVEGEVNADADINNPDKMWPWELPEGDVERGKGAADVASTPTPGGDSGYPQPKTSRHDQTKLTAFRARIAARKTAGGCSASRDVQIGNQTPMTVSCMRDPGHEGQHKGITLDSDDNAITYTWSDR